MTPARYSPGRGLSRGESARSPLRRYERTRAPQGERRILFAPDLIGTAEQILDRLRTDPVLAETTELRLELPYEFHRGDYEQILHDTVEYIAPELGWRPSTELV
ncbi:hypothetical protein [Nocardia sienata]|uniref:hypothetical protein n=1 Tax=Nocardia sienata TaxID=248552 RepID=UPI000AFFC695|nr:hypothetical protein [Nocardia sienata]